jgi:hypothetical protein
MPSSEKASLVAAGAVAGVLGILLTLFLLVGQVDAHYVTRKEYEATLLSINTQLLDIKAELHTQRADPVRR